MCPPPQLQCQTLAGQLQDAQAKLAAAREESKNGERLQVELQQVRERLDNIIVLYEQEQHQSAKKEVKSCI